jgi:MFS family permease
VYSFVAPPVRSIGLLAGGVLTEAINWHWIFFVNMPIGIGTALAAIRVLDATHGIGLRRGADLPGAVLIVSSLMLGVYTIVEAGDVGWGSAQTLGLGAIAAALLAGFVLRQAKAAEPLMPLRILRSRSVAGGERDPDPHGGRPVRDVLPRHAVPAAGPGLRPIGIGLAFLPVAVSIAALSLGVSARLITRFGARATLIPGLVLCAVGLVILERAPVGGDYVADVLPAMLLMGIGAGLSFPSLMTLAMSGATASDAGLASGLATRRSRSVARSASPCSPRCRRDARRAARAR